MISVWWLVPTVFFSIIIGGVIAITAINKATESVIRDR